MNFVSMCLIMRYVQHCFFFFGPCTVLHLKLLHNKIESEKFEHSLVSAAARFVQTQEEFHHHSSISHGAGMLRDAPKSTQKLSGYFSRNVLRAAAACSESVRASTNPDIVARASAMPWRACDQP